MISLSLFYMMKKHLEPYPAIQEKLVRALLVPLAIADVSHTLASPLPRYIRLTNRYPQLTQYVGPLRLAQMEESDII